MRRNIHYGDLFVSKENLEECSIIEQLTGDVIINEGVDFTATHLRKARDIYVFKGSSLTAPSLKYISGFVELEENTKCLAPALLNTLTPNFLEMHQSAYFSTSAFTVKDGILKTETGEYEMIEVDGFLLYKLIKSTISNIKPYMWMNRFLLVNGELKADYIYVCERIFNIN